MKKPNIFDYATKELSQDAFVCWLLECLKSDDEYYKRIGEEFVRFIIPDESTESGTIKIDGPYPQCYRIDVYAVVCIGNKAIPIIFEDKTDTYLHSDQMNKYCNMVNSWKNENYLSEIKEKLGTEELLWGDTRYIYFKTGYVPEWEKRDVENKESECENVVFKNIYLDEWFAFLGKLPSEYMIDDYRQHLENRKELNGKHGNIEKWDKIFRNIFGKDVVFESSYQGWAAKSFMYFDEGREDRNIWYSLRCGWWKKIGFAIAFQQYRNEKAIKRKKSEIGTKRAENTKEIKVICKEIFEELNDKYGFDFDKYVEENDGKSQNNIFKISVVKNDEDTVCSFFKDFLQLLIDAVKEKYGDRVKITENIEW